ncbi:hypothetical protein C8R47DRAFT_987754 [Mycena vitilis]|nr:hypothetical protein C8R47DRAFT_987754 [Mycena vitilis]
MLSTTTCVGLLVNCTIASTVSLGLRPLQAAIGCASAAGPAPVLLGTAANFAIIAKTGVSTVPDSAVTGDVGISPATAASLTGFSLTQDGSGQFWTSTQVDGRLLAATDALPTPGLLTIAVLDMQAAYTDASSQSRLTPVLSIGGCILVPGLYKWTTGVTISTGISLAGGPSDTWIFQIAGTLVQAAAVEITLVGGALSQNIIWVVADSVSIGANSIFQGNLLTQSNVVGGTNSIDNGCIYSQTDVALQKATVLCAGGVVPPPVSSSASATFSQTSAPVSSSPSSTTSSATTTYSAKCTPTAAVCFTLAFQGLNGSIHGDDYLSYILTDTVDGPSCNDLYLLRSHVQQSASNFVPAVLEDARLRTVSIAHKHCYAFNG